MFAEGDIQLYLDEDAQHETASGIALPIEEIGDLCGYPSILRALRLEREVSDPREVLAEATRGLKLEETRLWRELAYADAAQLHVGALFEVLGIERQNALDKPEDKNKLDPNRLYARQVLFDTAFAAESVLSSVKELWAPQTAFGSFNRLVDWTAQSLNVNVGDTRYMWTALHASYGARILPQFGLKSEGQK